MINEVLSVLELAYGINSTRYCLHRTSSTEALQDTVEKSGICSPLPLRFHGNTDGHYQVCANTHKALLE